MMIALGLALGMQTPTVEAVLDAAIAKYKLPAMGAAVVSVRGEPTVWVRGVRRLGSTEAVTPADQWHLGSCTKAMTGALVMRLVEQKKLSLDQTLGDQFRGQKIRSVWAPVTVRHLLAMQAGLPPDAPDWWRYDRGQTPVAARRIATQDALMSEPGNGQIGKFAYSNWSFVVAGSIAETIEKQPYEALLRREIFRSLGMNHSDFGPGGKGQPEPHDANGVVTVGAKDNPPVMTAAGRVRASLGDWARFNQSVLQAFSDRPGVIAASYAAEIRRRPLKGDYTLGWLLGNRPWGKGLVLSHAGSNTMNFAVVWVAPETGKAFMVVTNRSTPDVRQACDEVVAELIRRNMN